MALGRRPLRTKALTDKVAQCAPRTIYRHAARLTEQGLVERRQEKGVPSTVVYSLSEGGRDLFRLLSSWRGRSLLREANGGIEDSAWTSIALLGEMWGAGWIDQLSHGPRSSTYLAEVTPPWTFHQASRRVHMLASRGLLCEMQGKAGERRYRLADQTRQAMALVAGVGRWRQRHVEEGSHGGLSVPEMAAVLRTSLPLLKLPMRVQRQVKLGIISAAEGDENSGSATLTARIGQDGAVRCGGNPSTPDAWALGSVDTWFSVLLSGNRGRLRVGGDIGLVDACLIMLYEQLWQPLTRPT
jgi:DNA-binding HxlR family transcriptional regulator